MGYTTTKRDAEYLRAQQAGKVREAVRRDAADRAQKKQTDFEGLILELKKLVDLFLKERQDLEISEDGRKLLARMWAQAVRRVAGGP